MLAAYGGPDLRSTTPDRSDLSAAKVSDLLTRFSRSRVAIDRVERSLSFSTGRCYSWHSRGLNRVVGYALHRAVSALSLFRARRRWLSFLGDERLFWFETLTPGPMESFGRQLDSKGHAPADGVTLFFPLGGQAFRMSSPFSRSRRHPVLNVVRPHKGTDFAAPPGCAVYAAHAGTLVLERGALVLEGVLDGIAIRTIYRHVKRERSIAVGSRVESGQKIARIGTRERGTTGPHLHFEVFVKTPAAWRLKPASHSSANKRNQGDWKLIDPAQFSFSFY